VFRHALPALDDNIFSAKISRIHAIEANVRKLKDMLGPLMQSMQNFLSCSSKSLQMMHEVFEAGFNGPSSQEATRTIADAFSGTKRTQSLADNKMSMLCQSRITELIADLDKSKQLIKVRQLVMTRLRMLQHDFIDIFEEREVTDFQNENDEEILLQNTVSLHSQIHEAEYTLRSYLCLRCSFMSH